AAESFLAASSGPSLSAAHAGQYIGSGCRRPSCPSASAAEQRYRSLVSSEGRAGELPALVRKQSLAHRGICLAPSTALESAEATRRETNSSKPPPGTICDRQDDPF